MFLALNTTITTLSTLIERLREDYVGLMQEEAKVSNSLTQVTHDMDSQTQALEAQAEEYKQAQADLLSAQEVASETQKAYQAAKESLQSLLASYKEKAQAYQALDKDYQEAQKQMFDLMDHLKSKDARRQSLESIQKNHSNFYAGVKAVLQNAQSIQGIIGAVSEHLTFDTRYQTALEIAMGASGQNIIVEDEAAAKRSIDYLKRNRQGRATFLPLTTIKPRQLNGQFAQSLANAPGFIGMASDLVTYEDRLSNIFQNLLGVTAIFDTIDNANKAARAVRFQVRMVTLDGSEIRPGGAFAGGTNKQNNNLFIKPELDALTTEINQIKAQLSDSEAKVEALKIKRKALQKELEDFEGDNKLTTHNYMLEGQDNYREGVDGLKTGTTELAGASFVAHSNENGMSLITVVMNADNGGEDEAARFTATNELLDYVTQNWEIKTLNTKGQIIKKNDIKVADGDRQTISAKLESDLTVIQKINSKNDAVKIKAKTITAPIKKGDTIGIATFDDEDLVGTGYISDPPQISVTANQSIKKSFFLKVWWNHIVNFFTGNK